MKRFVKCIVEKKLQSMSLIDKIKYYIVTCAMSLENDAVFIV